MTITQTVEVPLSRRLVIDVPPEIPLGRVILAFTPARLPDATSEEIAEAARASSGSDAAGKPCPLCAKYYNPETGEPPYNAETIAALEEGDAMERGEIPVTWYNSAEEMWAALDADDEDD